MVFREYACEYGWSEYAWEYVNEYALSKYAWKYAYEYDGASMYMRMCGVNMHGNMHVSMYAWRKYAWEYAWSKYAWEYAWSKYAWA